VLKLPLASKYFCSYTSVCMCVPFSRVKFYFILILGGDDDENKTKVKRGRDGADNCLWVSGEEMKYVESSDVWNQMGLNNNQLTDDLFNCFRN
jgi:hypothetical protein